VRVAYADPPYIGQARKHYASEEVNHHELVARLWTEFPDGWALSASSPSLEEVLGICRLVCGPNQVRVAAWVKPFASFKPGVNPAYVWEPVVWRGGRQPRLRTEATVRDWVSANITLKKGLSGAKPVAFCEWLFDLLGLHHGDELVDLYPGTGIVSTCWAAQRGRECAACALIGATYLDYINDAETGVASRALYHEATMARNHTCGRAAAPGGRDGEDATPC
jgi:hypothetical protein